MGVSSAAGGTQQASVELARSLQVTARSALRVFRVVQNGVYRPTYGRPFASVLLEAPVGDFKDTRVPSFMSRCRCLTTRPGRPPPRTTSPSSMFLGRPRIR